MRGISFGLRRILLASIVVGVGSAASQNTANQNIVLHVLNGKNGKPISREHLLIYLGTSADDVRLGKKLVNLETDDSGLATLSLGSNPESLIKVWVDHFKTLCQKDSPNKTNFSIQEILKTGLSTPNNCGKVKANPTPKHFFVFVRSYSFWEKLRS